MKWVLVTCIFKYWLSADWELIYYAKWCIHQTTYKNVISTIGFKGNTERKRKENLGDLKCSPGSDIESQNLFYNVWPGHGQSRLIILTLSLPNATVVEFTVYCQTATAVEILRHTWYLTVFNRYKGRNSLFFISKCSGDILISYMEVLVIFCTKTDFTNIFANSLDLAEIKNMENMSVGMTYRTH